MNIKDGIASNKFIFNYNTTFSDNTSLFVDRIKACNNLFILNNDINVAALIFWFVTDKLQKIRVARNYTIDIN